MYGTAIAVTLLLLAVVVAAHRNNRRRKNRYFVAIPFENTLALTTLAQDTVLTDPAIASLEEDLWIHRIDCQWAIQGATAGEGPITVGFAHGDLSVAEIGEAINAAPTGPSDIIQNERARRPVRKSGRFDLAAASESLNDGKAIRTTGKMLISNGVAFNMWARNRGPGTLTTGASIKYGGVVYGTWKV